MTNEELERLAQLTVAELRPVAELLTEIAADTKTAVAELKNARPPQTEATGSALAARIEELRTELEARLPRRPRPWHVRWWVTAPPPEWWVPAPVWWVVWRTMVGMALAVAMIGTLAEGLHSWTTPITFLHGDGQIWAQVRLTWWRPPYDEQMRRRAE